MATDNYTFFLQSGEEVIVEYDTSDLGVTKYTAYIGDRKLTGYVGWPWDLEKLEKSVIKMWCSC